VSVQSFHPSVISQNILPRPSLRADALDGSHTRCTTCIKIADDVLRWPGDAQEDMIYLDTWQTFLDHRECGTCVDIIQHFEKLILGSLQRSPECYVALSRAGSRFTISSVHNSYLFIDKQYVNVTP
jgi:hypothetical protein